ncbi:hypothetical protein D3C87_1501420 [compost metagenome]
MVSFLHPEGVQVVACAGLGQRLPVERAPLGMKVSLFRPPREQKDVPMAANDQFGTGTTAAAAALRKALNGLRALELTRVAARFLQHIVEREFVPADPHGNHPFPS